MKKNKFINLFLIFGFILTCKSFVYAGRNREEVNPPSQRSPILNPLHRDSELRMEVFTRVELQFLGYHLQQPVESTQNRNVERNSRNNNSTVLNPNSNNNRRGNNNSNLNNNRRGNDVLKLNNNGNRDDVGATCEHDQIIQLSGFEKGCLNIN